jgi:hypothetical protein
MEAIRSSETSVNARSTQRHIPEDNILHSHRCESLKSYIVFLYGEATHRHIRRLETLQTSHAGSSLADFSTLKMEAIRSSETLANTRSTQCHIPEDDILHSHRCESLKSYKFNNVLLIINWAFTYFSQWQPSSEGRQHFKSILPWDISSPKHNTLNLHYHETSVHQNTSHTTTQPCPHTQDQHNTDGPLWRNTAITGIYSKTIISRKIVLLLINHILNILAP